MKTILILAAALALMIATPAAGDSGNEFYASCSGPGASENYCIGYVLGAIEGWSAAMGLIREGNPEVHLHGIALFALCPPDDHNLKQAFDIVVKYLRDHPEHRDRSMALLTRIALSEAWPCR